MTPTQRIRAGLLEVHQGLADLREDHERVAREQEIRQADLVDAEEGLRGLASRAERARGRRHLLPAETTGSRRPVADLRPATSSPPPCAPASAPTISAHPANDLDDAGLEDTLDGYVLDEDTLPSARGPAPATPAREVRVDEVLVGSFDPRGAVVVESHVDAVTRRSLIRMGLACDPGAPAPAKPAGSWLARARQALAKEQ